MTKGWANDHLYLLNVAITDLLKTLASLSHALGRLEAAGESCTNNCQPYQHTNRFCIPVEPPPPFLDNVQKIDTFSSSDVFPKVNGKKRLFQGYMFQSPEPLEEEHLTCLEAVCQGLTSLQLLQLSCVPEGGLFCRSEL